MLTKNDLGGLRPGDILIFTDKKQSLSYTQPVYAKYDHISVRTERIEDRTPTGSSEVYYVVSIEMHVWIRGMYSTYWDRDGWQIKGERERWTEEVFNFDHWNIDLA